MSEKQRSETSKILQIPDEWPIEKKRELVLQRLEYLDRVPDGKIHGIEFDQGYENENYVERYEEYGKRYFRLAQGLFGKEDPEILEQRLIEFEINLNRVKNIAKLNLLERKSLPSHTIFPYFGNFDNFIKRSRRKFSELEIDELKFTEKLIGRGGFSDIYFVEGGDKGYALKLIRGEYNMSRVNFQDRKNLLKFIFENLSENREPFSKHPFLPILAITSFDYFSSQANWYIQEFFEGQSVQKALKKGLRKQIIGNKELIGNILLTYAEMLQELHKKKRLFVDNNWGAVLFNDKSEIKICDYDFSQSIGNKILDLKQLYYSPKESISYKLRTIESEYEMFMLMADHLFFGYPFIKERKKWYGISQKRKVEAKENKRKYPKQRRESLPKNIREVGVNFIEYLRNKQNMGVEDIISAINLDYFE